MAEPDCFIPRYQENLPLRDFSTLQIGGPCSYFTSISTLEDWIAAIRWSRKRNIRLLIIGEGSNLLFPDSGFPGLVARNEIGGLTREGVEIEVGGGKNLGEVIRFLNQQGLEGMERMYGIPGTVAGAVVGNAGAYGQEISDHITEVDVWAGDVLRTFTRNELGFAYRSSRFKTEPDWFASRLRFKFQKSGSDLQAMSDVILARRSEKYPPGLKCPGSFFKNVLVEQLTPEQLRNIPKGFIQFGKIPAGRLLEFVGAKGASRGMACFADYHANLVLNRGGATASDILNLADEYSGRVRERFGIQLEPEIQIIPS